MKYLRLLLCALLTTAVPMSALAGDDEKIVGQVRGFYEWYFHLLNTTPASSGIKEHRKEFKRYIAEKLLNKIARAGEGAGQEGDPFFLQPDWDPAWEKNIEVSHVKAGAKGGASAEIRLSGKEMPVKRLKLTLTLEDGAYKIVRIEEIPDEAADKPAPTATP